jgi:hypothetical protein
VLTISSAVRAAGPPPAEGSAAPRR